MKVKGNILKARIAFVEERFGSQGWSRVLESLGPEDQKILGGSILNLSWYPFDCSTRLDEAIVKVLGGGNTRLFEEMGKASAKENLTGVHSNLVAPGDPQAFMRKAQVIYQFYYDTGYRTYEETGPTSGVMTTYEAKTFSTADCSTVIGWYREALAMCGAKDVQVVEDTCRARGGDFCRYKVSWR